MRIVCNSISVTRSAIVRPCALEFVEGLAMSLAEVLPEVQSLSRQDKLRLIQFLAEELERDAGGLLPAGPRWRLWRGTVHPNQGRGVRGRRWRGRLGQQRARLSCHGGAHYRSAREHVFHRHAAERRLHGGQQGPVRDRFPGHQRVQSRRRARGEHHAGGGRPGVAARRPESGR